MKAPPLSRRASLALLVGSAAAVACNEVPKGGVAKSPEKPKAALSRRLMPNDIMPGDLDIVVRIDLDRIKKTLGSRFEEELTARYGQDEMLKRLIAKGRTITVGQRLADLDEGDHVIVVEGDHGPMKLAEEGFEPAPSKNDKVRVFVRSSPSLRAGTAAVVILDERAIALVSPVETDAVLRILREGPDERRGQPVAEGVVSADLRPRRLPAPLERKFPSFGRLLSQVQRIKAILRVGDDGVRLEGEIIAKSDAGAAKVRQFLDVFREGASRGEGATALLKNMKLDKVGAVVRVTSVMSIEDVAKWMAAQ